MSNLDVLENALSFIRNDLERFYALVADVDNRLVNAENFLLDNGDVLNPIFSNIDDTSIFTSYSEASRETRTEPIRLEDIHLRATKPTLITPDEPIQTCNVSMTAISFSNFNQYFSSTLGDTLEFYVTHLPDIRNSLESNIPFITDGLNLIRDSNFKISNDFFTIQPDFRDQTIDINICAIDSSNAYKYEQYDSFNYLSDPYIIRIVEQAVSSIIKIHPDSCNDTIIFPYTEYHIRNNLKENVLFLKTFINNIDQTSITTTPNINSIYYEYELPIDNIVFSNIDKEYYSNFDNEYYYIFDFRGSNNEPKETTVQIMTYDPLYYQYYKDKKTITNVIIQEPPPIILINGSSNNFVESQEGYNSFEINYLNLFSNYVDLNQQNIHYEYEIISDISVETNRFYTSLSENKYNVVKQTSDTIIQINTDYRNQNYSIIITAKHNDYLELPTYYTINITELEPPKPTQISLEFPIEYEHSETSETIILNDYFVSGTSNTNLSFHLTSNTDYPNDEYANLFEITNSILSITKNKYFNSERTLKKTLIITDTAYNVFETIELTFNQKSLIDITNPISDLTDIYESTIINLTDYITINLNSIQTDFTIESNINLISIGKPNTAPIVKNNNTQFTINPDFRDKSYSLTIKIKPITPLYSSFENFNFTINVTERELTPPYLIDQYKGYLYTLSNNNFELDLNAIYCNTITGFDLVYFVSPINTELYDINGPKITFTPEYRDISYNITIKASNLEYNIESTLQNALRINIIEDNPIRSLQNFTNITENIDTTLFLSNYFESKESNRLNFNIKYLDHITKTEITLRSNIDNIEPTAKIEDNKLIIMPDYRNQTYLIEIEAKDSIYSIANLNKEIKIIEGIKPTIETLIENDTILTITQNYFTLDFSKYFDIRYHILPEYKDQVQLGFEIEIISRDTDLEILLFYKNNKLYYADSFDDITDNEFSIAYVDINYRIITTSQLTLYKNGREYFRSQNNVLSFKPTAIGDILDASDNLLFTINELKIKTYLDDPKLNEINNDKAKTIKEIIDIINLTDDTAPTIIHINIYNNYNSLMKLNTKTLKLNRPIFTSLLVDNLRHNNITCNMQDLVKVPTSDIFRYDFSFSILTDSNLYCNDIVVIDSNEIIVKPYYRNESYLIYIDVFDNDIQAISDQLVYKFVELPVLEINSYIDSFTFTSNQYIFDYSNFITNYAIDFNLTLNITVLSNTTYIPINDYNIRDTRNDNPFYIIDNNNKKLTINPDFRNDTYDLNLFFDITDITRTDITKAINCNLTIPLQINEEKIPSIIYNQDLPTFDITNNESNQIINLKEFYNYKYLDYLNFETIFPTFSNEHINIVDSNLSLKFDYHNCNYDIIIKVTDTFYLPNESNIDLELTINEEKTIKDISATYDFDQFINIYKIDIDIDMTELFENLTHYPNTNQQFNISLSNNKYSDNTLYYSQDTSNLKITANDKGEEYYIIIESFMNGSSHYEDEKLSKTFNIIELPVINIKSYILTNPLYFSNIYDVYSCNYPFYNYLEIEQSISKTNKYIDNSKYIPDIIQYSVSDSINTTSYTYIENKRGIEYNVSFDINVIDFKNETLNSNFNFSVTEDPPIEYISGSNQTIHRYNDSINITSKFRNNTSCNLIIDFIGGYEITSNVKYNEATNYISKYSIDTYTFPKEKQASSSEQPNISTNVYNPIEEQITKNTNNVVFGFWCKEHFDITLNINDISQNINYTTTDWFYALIVYIPNSNSISIYNNMDIESNITGIVTQEVTSYTIQFNSSSLVSKLSLYSNMDERTHKALTKNIKTDLSFKPDNPFRYGKESTLAFNYDVSTTDLDIILANSSKKYELLFDAYIENYENFKKLEYSVIVQENDVVIPVGGLSIDRLYTKSISVEITDSSQFDTPEKIETVRQSMIKSLVSEKFSKDTTIDPTALEVSLKNSVVLELEGDELVITVNPDISQATTTDEYIADLQAIVTSGEQITEPQEIVSQSIILKNIDYTALTPEDKAIIIEKTKQEIRETNSDLIDNDDIVITLSGNGDKVIVSTAIKATVETAQTIKEGLEPEPEDSDPPVPNLAEKIIEKVIDQKEEVKPVITDILTVDPVPETVKDTILRITLDGIIYIEADKSIFKNIINEELSPSTDKTIETQITPTTPDNYVNIVISIKTSTISTDTYDTIALSTTIKNEYLSTKSTIIKVPTVPTTVETININVTLNADNKYILEGTDSTPKTFDTVESYAPSNVQNIQILKGVKLNLVIDTSSEHPFIIVKSTENPVRTDDVSIKYTTDITYSGDSLEYETDKGLISGTIIWDTANSDVGTYYGICINHFNMYFIINLVTTIKQKETKTIKSFDIVLEGIDFDGLTKNDKEELVELAKTKSENKNTGKTVKDVKILRSTDSQGVEQVIIKTIYEIDPTDPTDDIQIPDQTDIASIVTDFTTKKETTQNKISASSLSIETPITKGNIVETTIKIDEIIDGDLDEESIIKAVKDQISRKTGEPVENIEIDIQYVDEGEQSIEIKTTITTSNTAEIADVMENHPSLKDSLVTEITNTEQTYSNSPEDITASAPEPVTTSDKSVTELELTLPYIDTQTEENKELIKTKITEQFSEIREEDITITFDSETEKVIVSVRQDAGVDLPELDSETLQNDIIDTELKEQNVLEEESTFVTEPTTQDSVSTEKETVSFEFLVEEGDKDSINIEIIKSKVSRDTGADQNDIVVEVNEDGTVKVDVSYTPGVATPVTVDDFKTSVSQAISVSITDTKLGFISTGSFSTEATEQPAPLPPQQASTGLDKDTVEFNMKISSVDYSEMDQEDLNILRQEIREILLRDFDEATVKLALENIIFSSGSLKITLKIELASTVTEGKTLNEDVLNKLNEIFDGKTRKQHIADSILESFNTNTELANLRNKLEPGKTEESIGIVIDSISIIKASSNNFQVRSVISFTDVNFNTITEEQKTEIKTQTKNIIHSAIESSSASVSLSTTEVNITVSTNKGIFGIEALETALNELKETIKTDIREIITEQTDQDPGEGTIENEIDENTETALLGLGDISSSDELIYNKDLGNIILVGYSNIINVSQYIELTDLKYEIIIGNQFIASAVNEKFIIINEGNSNTHPIEINGIKESANTKIIFSFNIVESHETAITLSGNSNFSHYPLIFEQKYLLTDLYDYYRKDYINYSIYNLDGTHTVSINANKELIINPENNTSQYNFTIKAEDPLKSFINEDITFTIKNVVNVDSTNGEIITPITTAIDKDITDQTENIDFLDLYILDKTDSNILSVDTRIEGVQPEFLDLIKSNINILNTNMVLRIIPTNIKLNYTIRLYVAYKDSITGNEINRFNSSIRYQIQETGVFSFYSHPDTITLTYPLINLTNNEITCNLIENINLHYTTLLNINDIKFSNINSPILDNAHYKDNIYSNAYILDTYNKDLIFSSEYRNRNYTIEILAYFEDYSNVKLTQIYQIQEAEIPQIILNHDELSQYTYTNQSNQVIYLSNILSRYNYIYSNELEITYTFNPSTLTDANPYIYNLTNDTLRIETDYRGINYDINITVTDSNFNRTNNDINITITEIEPFVLIGTTGNTRYKTFNNLENDRLLISLNEYYDINIPTNKNNNINIKNVLLTDIDITGDTYQSNIENDIITLIFDYRTILTVTNEIDDRICLTKTNDENIITANTFNASYFIAENNNDNITTYIASLLTPLPSDSREPYQYKKDDYFIWNTKNVKLNTEYYIINYNKYDQNDNKYMIIKFIDINDINYNKITKILNYDNSIRDVYDELTINSNVIVHLTDYDNLFNYNANYRNSNIPVEVTLHHIDYPHQEKTINFTFSEDSLGDIEYNDISVELVSSNTIILTYNLYEVYCNNAEFDRIEYSVFEPIDTESYISFENCNILIQPDFRGITYDITIKAEDTGFGINNTDFSINIEEYPPLKFNEGFNSNIVIENLSNTSIIYNLFNDITVYATHCNLIFSNSYLSNCLDTDIGNYNLLKLFSNPIDSLIDTYDLIDSNIYDITFNPEYRNKNYEIGYNIYMSGYEEQYIQVKFIITEINIPEIVKLESISSTISNIYESNIPDIINLSDLYDYPYSNELVFNITTTSNYSYDNRILTFTPDFRNTNYTLNIEAYDPYFTNQTSQNSSNNIINYNITEKPPLEFDGIPSLTFTYQVNNEGTSSYVFADSYDRNTSITGNNPVITVYVGDKIVFNRITDDHPINIRNSVDSVDSVEDIAQQIDQKTTYTFNEIGVFEYYCTSGHSSMIGTINVNEIPLFDQTVIINNLGREEKHYNIIDNVRIYAIHCNITIDNTTTLSTRTAYYNENYPNSITVTDNSNLTIATEHRGESYTNVFDIYMSGYDIQKLTKSYDITELSIPGVININNVYTSTIEETKRFILEDLYVYPYADELIFSIIDSKQKLKTVENFENSIEDLIIYGLSNINDQCNLFIDLEINEQEFKFTIKAEDLRFQLSNLNLTIEITKDTPLNFNIVDFTNQLMIDETIENMSNSIITIDFFDKYVSNIDEGNILVIEPMYPHNSNINGRLAYYPDYYPTYNVELPYKIIDSNVYFLPEYRGNTYSNIFKLYARNVECNINYDSYYLQVNCICIENTVPPIIFNNDNKNSIFTLLTLRYNSIVEETYNLSTLYTYPYLNYLEFKYDINIDIPYSNTVMEQSNLNIILKPKFRGKNYTITIDAYDRFEHSNVELTINIDEIPAIRFTDENEYADRDSNIKSINVNDLTNTQIICNLESYIINNSDTIILFSNIFPEVREAYYDTTTNKNALKRIDTTFVESNVINITTDIIEEHNGKDSYKVDSNIIENINKINNKEFSVAFNFYFIENSIEIFTIKGNDLTEVTDTTILKCEISNNNISFITNTLTTIEKLIDSGSGWYHIVFNFKSNTRELYINNNEIIKTESGLNNDYTNMEITINSNIEYFQNFKVIDKPLTITDIDYLYNNEVITQYYDKEKLYINPEYRNQNYIAQIILKTEGYEEISRTLEFNITETEIPPITLKPQYNDILSYTYCNLLNYTCNIENISDLYNYPFSNHLIFTTSTNKTIQSYNTDKSYIITTNNDELSITADYRDMDYIVTLTATDPVDKFNLFNSNFEVFIHEKPPIEFDNFELIYTEYLCNLEKTELNCNIYDNIIINVDSKYVSNLSYDYQTPTEDIRKAFYNLSVEGDRKNAYYITESNLDIIPEYRNQNYTLDFNIKIEGYESQTINKIYDITECNIPPIVIDQTVNSNFVGLSNEPFINNDLADYFTTYPFKDDLKFIIIEPEDIENRKPFVEDTFKTESVENRQIKVKPDFRDSTYNIKLLIYDRNFSYFDNVNYNSDTRTYKIPGFKDKTTDDINNLIDNNNNNSNFVNESLDLYFTEIPPIEFNTTIDIIYYCNLTKDTETCNIYPNIKFNAPVEPIITSFEYSNFITPRHAFYKSNEESNAILITDLSNINIYPEYRNQSYIINVDIKHSNYPNQIITQTFFIHECNIPDIEFKYSDITFQHLEQETTAINLVSNNDLKEYYEYPFINELEYNYNISNITQDIPNVLIRDPDITINDSNITILPDYKGYMYAVEITTIDTNFGISNTDFIITIDEKAPIELRNTPNIYSNFIVIDNLSNVDHIISATNIYTRNHTDSSTAVRKDVHNDSSSITDFKQRDPDNSVINFGTSSLTISPYYRDVDYNYVYDIYIDNTSADTHKYQYFKLKLVVNVIELPIPPINVYNSDKLIYSNLSNNVITIENLKSLYDYPFIDYLKIEYSNSHTGDYDINLTDSNLIVTTGLRDKTYTLTLLAYDPLFTYHHDIDYVDCNLTENDLNSNLINETLQFEFQELPAIRFRDGSINTKTVNIITVGNIQSNIDIRDHVTIFTDHSNYMLSNASVLPRNAYYISGDHSNAVFFGYANDYGEIMKSEDTLIYINPEYRGHTYTVDIDIYMSNFMDNKLTLSLNITEENIPVIELNTDLNTTRTVSIDQDIISNLKDQYNYVYSNQLQFTCNIIENETTIGYDITLDGDTLTIDPNLRGNNYQVTIIAYDPNFTYHTEVIYDDVDLTTNTANSNLINEALIFNFEETPSIYFKNMDYSNLSKTISINAPNNTNIQCNLVDILSNQTTEGIYIIENITGLPDEAYYINDNNSNAVYFGDLIENIVTINTNPIININPEYRGYSEYTVSFDIYASNFTDRKLSIDLVITEEDIPNIELIADIQTDFSNLSNNIIVIENLRDKYNYVYSNELQLSIVNNPIDGVILSNETLTITPELRNSAYNIIINAEELNIKQNGNDVSNNELIFNIEEIPSIRFKDSYIGSNHYRFDISQYSGNNHTFNQNDLTTHMFVKGLEECNIILEIKDSSTFGNYSLSESSNELNIVFDYDYYEACNIDIKAYLENYDDIKLETTIRVIIPPLGAPVLINDKQYYNLIGDNYLDPITHKFELYSSNIFKNTQDVEHLTINITNISLPDSFGYSENMIYSYIKPTDSDAIYESYCNLPPLYQELTVDVENIFGSNTFTLRFINIDEINSLAIADILNPTYKIDITQDFTCNINSDFEIVYVNENITNITKNSQDLVITNSNRGLYYDVIINDSNYNYVYRIVESGDSAKPILVNNSNYFNLVSNSITEYSNIFKNFYSYDLSEITIYEITTYQDAFTIDKNKLIPDTDTDIETILFSESNVIEVEIKASNLYQSNTETLKFFKIDDSLSNINGLSTPTQIINFESTDNSCNISIGEDFDIIFDYSNIDNEYVIKEGSNLIISNVGRLITYDIVIKLIDTNHSYIYRINESRIIGNPPILKESSLYYYLVDTTSEQDYSNIFTVTDITDDANIKISYIDRTDVFTILDNSIHSHSITHLFPENEYLSEINIRASNLDGETEETLRFLRLGYTTLTVPNLTNENVSNIYLLEDEVTYDVGKTFSIEYNPIESGCNLEIDNCNLIINDDYRGIYDTVIGLDEYIVNIFRINEREDNTIENTYSV